ncbi:DUF397 domain-containing protein [Lentzea sp. NPDC092896]
MEVRLSNTEVDVRDSKNVTGPRFAVSADAWLAFLGSIPHGPDPAQ